MRDDGFSDFLLNCNKKSKILIVRLFKEVLHKEVRVWVLLKYLDVAFLSRFTFNFLLITHFFIYCCTLGRSRWFLNTILGRSLSKSRLFLRYQCDF